MPPPVVSELLFNGKIPAEFSIVESDVTSVKIPLPYYALLSRMSYLPLETLEVVNHFKGSVIELEQAIWFECDGKPLKSNLPIGVLFDLHAAEEAVVPWKIVIHFRQFPGNKVIRSSTQAEAEKLFSHAVKQSVFLLSGNTRLFTSLSILKQTDLHQSIATGDCILYNEIIKEITSSVTLDSARSIPVAIVVSDGRPMMQRPVSAYTEILPNNECATPPTSTPVHDSAGIEHRNEESRQSAHTEGVIKDELKEENKDKEEKDKEMETFCSDTDNVTVNKDKICIESKGRLTTLHDVISNALNPSGVRDDDISVVLIHGIALPLDASIYEIWERFCHLDLFLYITVHLKKPISSPSALLSTQQGETSSIPSTITMLS